ncbi:MAG: ribosome maturation factor RimM [Nocardioidaceae bacterium]
MSDPRLRVVVGRIGRAHGLRGEVSVEPRTDEPERRFAAGATLATQSPNGDPAGHGRPAMLTVAGTRWHQDRLLVRFAEVADRNAADVVRGLLLAADVNPTERPADPDEYYDHQLVGLEVVTDNGGRVGEVVEVVHGPVQELLAIRTDVGELLVPFVEALVPEVDLVRGRVVVADHPGLLAPLDSGGED